MNKEIKEIIEWLSDEDIYLEDNGYQYKRISLRETKLLLDYITNLQEELQEENKKLKDRIHALEEHNKHLGKEAQRYFDMLMDNIDNKDIVQYACDLEDKICYYNERIDKAIEYIKENDYHYMNEYALERFRNNLLEILKRR